MSASTEILEPMATQTVAESATTLAVVPRVDLLPPEIVQRHQLVRIKRSLSLIGIGLVVALGVAVAGTYGMVTRAQSKLEAAQAQSDALMAKKAEFKAAPEIQAATDLIESSRERVLAMDVVWERYVNAIQIMAGSNYKVSDLKMSTTQSAGALPALNSGQATTGVGSISMAWQAQNLLDAKLILEALNKVPGLADASLSTVSKNNDTTPGSLPFIGETTVIMTDKALSHRFDRKAQ